MWEVIVFIEIAIFGGLVVSSVTVRHWSCDREIVGDNLDG